MINTENFVKDSPVRKETAMYTIEEELNMSDY